MSGARSGRVAPCAVVGLFAAALALGGAARASGAQAEEGTEGASGETTIHVQDESDAPKNHAHLMAIWTKTLDRAEADLEAGRWEKAKERCVELLAKVKPKLQEPQGAPELLTRLSLVRALAEQALGQTRAANWDYATALALDPAIAEASRSAATAPLLAALRDGWAAEEAEARAVATAGAVNDPAIELPRTIGLERPELPFPILKACATADLDLRFIVGVDGVHRHPVVSGEREPIFIFSLLDAVRGWSYRPAKLRGKPVAVILPAGTRFHLDTCEH